MALLEKANPANYSIGAQISQSGSVFLCNSKEDTTLSLVVKKISTKKSSVSEIQDQGDKYKSSLVKSMYILLPDYFWEDKKEQCIYVVMSKMTQSLNDIINEGRQKGIYVSILLLRKCLEDSFAGLRKIHNKKLFHGNIKPSNILVNEDDEYNLSDLGLFSQIKSDEYQPPEMTQSMMKQGPIAKQNSNDSLDSGQRCDVWQLGITFLQIATLGKATEFGMFRDPNQADATKPIKKKLKARYGKSFLSLLEQMLQIYPAQRRKVNELEELIQDFMKEEHTNQTDERVESERDMYANDTITLSSSRNQNNKNSEIDDAYNKIITSCAQYMEKMKYSIITLYQKCDQSGANNIQFPVFKKFLKNTIDIYFQNEDLFERVFERIDQNGNEKINFQEFRDAIYGGIRLTPQQLQSAKELFLGNRDINNDGQMKQLFSTMTNGNEITFPQFLNHAKDFIPNISIIEVDQLFTYFDRNSQEHINYNIFAQVMRETVNNNQPRNNQTNQPQQSKQQYQYHDDINQTRSSESAKIVDFMVNSGLIQQALEDVDVDQNNTLTVQKVQQAFIRNNGPNVSIDQLKQTALELGALNGDKINYKQMFKSAKNLNTTNNRDNGSRIQSVCDTIKQYLQYKHIDLQLLLKNQDRDGSGRIPVSVIKSEMKDRGFSTTQEEFELLFSFTYPDGKNKIDYKEFNTLIMKGPDAIKKTLQNNNDHNNDQKNQQKQRGLDQDYDNKNVQNKKINQNDIDNAYEKVIVSSAAYMEKMKYSINAFFRKCNKGGNNLISFSEFEKFLQSAIEVNFQNDDLFKRVFDRIDKDGDDKINLQELKDAIYGGVRLSSQQIQSARQNFLENRDINNKSQMQQLFSKITADQVITFPQFLKHTNLLMPYFSIIEVDQLFQQFDRSNNEHITYETFAQFIRGSNDNYQQNNNQSPQYQYQQPQSNQQQQFNEQQQYQQSSQQMTNQSNTFSFASIVDFLVNSNQLLQSLQEEDIDENNTLTVQQIQKAFASAHGPSVNIDQIKQTTLELGVLKGNLVNYKQMLKQAKGSKLQNISDNIKQQVLYKDIDLLKLLRSQDRDGSGRITKYDIINEMKNRGFKITTEEIELLLSFANPDNNNKIDYKEFNSLIMQGFDGVKKVPSNNIDYNNDQKYQPQQRGQDQDPQDNQNNKNKKINHIDIDDAYEKVIVSCATYMDKKDLSLIELYRKCDKIRDNFIQFKEFKTFLQSVIVVHFKNDDLYEKVFDHIDKDQDSKINFQEFKDAIYGNTLFSPQQIQSAKQKFLGTRSIDNNNQMQHLFSTITSGQEIDFLQFCKFSRRQIPNISIIEIDQLFLYFDRNSKGHINQDTFAQVMRESDVINQSKQFKPLQQFETKYDQSDDHDLINQTDALDSAKIVDYLASSRFLPQALEKLDVQNSNFLTILQVKQAFLGAQGPDVNIQQIKQTAHELGALNGDKIQYKQLVNSARDKNSLNHNNSNSSKLEKLCDNIKQDLQFKKIDLSQLLGSYDRDRSGRVAEAVIISELQHRGLKVTKEDYDLLFSFAQPDDKKCIDLKEFNLLIMEGPEALKKISLNNSNINKDNKNQAQQRGSDKDVQDNYSDKNRKTNRTDVDNAYDKVILACSNYMEKMNYTLISFYRKCDKNEDNMVSFSEFQKIIQNTVQVHFQNEDLYERVFERIDLDVDSKINFQELKDAIYGKVLISPQQIEQVKHLFLDKQDINNNNQMQQLFSRITKGQEITFPQFCQFARDFIPEISIIELDQLFTYFDRKSQDKIDFITFVQVMKDSVDSNQLKKNQSQQYRTQTQQQQFQQQQQLQSPQQLNAQSFSFDPNMINQTNASDSAKILDFMANSNNLVQRFQDLDINGNNILTISQVLQVLTSVGGPSVNNEQIRQIALDSGALNGNMVNYLQMIKSASNKNRFIRNNPDSNKIQKICDYIQQNLQYNKVDLIQLFKDQDQDRSGRVADNVIMNEMRKLGLRIAQEDFDILFSLAQPDLNNRINYREFNQLIMQGPDALLNVPKKNVNFHQDLGNQQQQLGRDQDLQENRNGYQYSNSNDVDNAYNDVIQKCQAYMEKMKFNMSAFYHKCDKNQDNFIQFQEFQRILQETINVQLNRNLQERVFERMDQDKDDKISFQELKNAIYGAVRLTPQDIQQVKTYFLDRRNINDNNQMQQLFSTMNNGQEITFQQFCYITRQFISNISIIYLDQLFAYFDRNGQDRINQITFIQVMRESVDNNQIKQTLSQYQPNSQQQNQQQQNYQKQQQPQQQQYQQPYQMNAQLSPQFQNNPMQPSTQNQQDIYKQFMNDLSYEVQSKQCFYLYEQLVNRKEGFITMDDFEKTTKQILTNTNPNQIQTVRQYLQKDGNIRLSDLAQALNCKLNGAQQNQQFQQQQFYQQQPQQQQQYQQQQQQQYQQQLQQQQQQQQQYQQPQQINPQQPQYQNQPMLNQQDIYKDFMNDLSRQVLSKGCFNLYEQLDFRKVGFITMPDFERTTKQILTDTDPREIDTVRQYLQKDGNIRLSDLAQALNCKPSGAQGNQADRFNIQQDKQQFGINQKGNQANKKNAPNQQAFFSIQVIINGFLKKKQKDTDDLKALYFPPNGPNLIDKANFVQKTISFNMGLSPAQCDDFFEYLDINQSGQISINEYKQVFPSQGKPDLKNIENVVVSKELDEEIDALFKSVDTNQSNSLDQKELQKALVSVGINPSIDELQQYFKIFDKNNDGTIQYQEFNIIIKEFIKNEMLHADEILDQIRKEFRAVCNPATRQLNKPQVQHVFNNLGVNIKEDELDVLFTEIDDDKSGSVDIDEFIYFIQKNQSGMSAKASAAVMNIKGARRISLHELRDIFKSMPSNFIMSFILNQNKKMMNLPSSALKPKLDSSGLFYQDLNYVEVSNLNIKQSVLDKQSIKNNICFEIKILDATGIPVPQQEQNKGDQFLQREVGFILFDRQKNKFDGNTAFVKAQWKQECEDQWMFEALDNSILIRWGNYDERLDASIDLVIEMITYVNKKGRLIQISCSYASISIASLKVGKQFLDLKGGQPSKDLTIDSKDIRTNRTGWRSVVKTLSSAIKSQISIEITKPTTNPQLQQMMALPDKFIINKWALLLWRGFREYYAYRTVSRGDIQLSLSSDSKIKAWLNAIDCPDTYRPLANFWNQFIEPKCTSHQFQLNAVQAIGDQFYMLFVNHDFKFCISDTSRRNYTDNALMKKRQDLINETIQELKISIGVGPPNQQQQQRKPVNYSNMEPVNVMEVMDNDDEEQASIDKFLQRKLQKSIK